MTRPRSSSTRRAKTCVTTSSAPPPSTSTWCTRARSTWAAGTRTTRTTRTPMKSRAMVSTARNTAATVSPGPAMTPAAATRPRGSCSASSWRARSSLLCSTVPYYRTVVQHQCVLRSAARSSCSSRSAPPSGGSSCARSERAIVLTDFSSLSLSLSRSLSLSLTHTYIHTHSILLPNNLALLHIQYIIIFFKYSSVRRSSLVINLSPLPSSPTQKQNTLTSSNNSKCLALLCSNLRSPAPLSLAYGLEQYVMTDELYRTSKAVILSIQSVYSYPQLMNVVRPSCHSMTRMFCRVEGGLHVHQRVDRASSSGQHQATARWVWRVEAMVSCRLMSARGVTPPERIARDESPLSYLHAFQSGGAGRLRSLHSCGLSVASEPHTTEQ